MSLDDCTDLPLHEASDIIEHHLFLLAHFNPNYKPSRCSHYLSTHLPTASKKCESFPINKNSNNFMPLFTFLNINHHEKEEAVSDKSLIATEPGSRDLFAPIKNSRQFDAPKQTKTFLKVSKPQADNSRGSSVEQRNKQRTVASSLCDCLGIVSDELSQPPLL